MEKEGSLYQEHQFMRIVNAQRIDYPGIIFSNNVKIMKTDDYKVLDEYATIVVITAAAPDLRYVRCTEEELKAALKNKIRAILNTAILNGTDILLLGAFGCGAFRNPPQLVADIFSEILNSEVVESILYKECFKKTAFVIRTKSNRENKNYDVFNSIVW